jgi:hypothetical protein
VLGTGEFNGFKNRNGENVVRWMRACVLGRKSMFQETDSERGVRVGERGSDSISLIEYNTMISPSD